jgi:hypothetical protein
MMQYFPGTKIFEEARQLGLIAEDFRVDQISGYFKNTYLKQGNLQELQNIHSFSILVSKHRTLEFLAKFLTKRFRPNLVFQAIFQLSYGWLTIRRANFRLKRILHGWKYYLLQLEK